MPGNKKHPIATLDSLSGLFQFLQPTLCVPLQLLTIGRIQAHALVSWIDSRKLFMSHAAEVLHFLETRCQLAQFLAGLVLARLLGDLPLEPFLSTDK